MADVKLNSLATKTNANAAAILVKDSATQNAGAEGWITKAQLSQIIRDEIKAQMSAITSGTPDVPVLDGSTLKYMTLANFAKVAGELVGVEYARVTLQPNESIELGGNIIKAGFYSIASLTTTYSCVVQLYYRGVAVLLETPGMTKNLSFESSGNISFRMTNIGSSVADIIYRHI